ncbi:MAG: alpha/beta fold hydrolase [Proteobacteria bacterium]|nr:alpha/beta fold hydrolase [Pseudomonadota bacterium]
MQSNFIQTRDLRMHYLQVGTGEPLIFIHGFPETSFEWRHQLEHFGKRYACFAPDTRGYGQTDKPGIRCTRTLLAQDIVNFMDALGLEKAAVVAHDWGGIIAFKLAIDWPERVTRLALLDTLCTVWIPMGVHGYWFKAAPHPEELFAAHHAGFIETLFAGGATRPMPGRPQSPWQGLDGACWASDDVVNEYKRAFADPLSHFHAISYYRDALPFHIVTPDSDATQGERFEFLDQNRVSAMWNHPEGLEAHPLYSNFLDYGPEDRHKHFTAPVLWGYGSGSAAGDASQPGIPQGNPFFDQFSRYFSDLRGRAIAGGHFFPEENPTATNAVLDEFFAEQPVG